MMENSLILFQAGQYIIVIICAFFLVLGFIYLFNYLSPIIRKETYIRKIEASNKHKELLEIQKQEKELSLEYLDIWKVEKIKRIVAKRNIKQVKKGKKK